MPPSVPEPAPLPTPPADYTQPPPPGPRRWDWPAPEPVLAPPYSGFYTHVRLHLGLLSRPGATDGVVDTGGGSLALGHSVFTGRLVAFVQLQVQGDQSPRQAGVMCTDLAVGYHLPFARLFVAGLLSSGAFAFTDAEGERVRMQGAGPGVLLVYDWAVRAGPAAVGFGLDLRTLSVEQRRLYSASLGVAFTYH